MKGESALDATPHFSPPSNAIIMLSTRRCLVITALAVALALGAATSSADAVPGFAVNAVATDLESRAAAEQPAASARIAAAASSDAVPAVEESRSIKAADNRLRMRVVI
ncbi:hypothetical protein P43SY_011827 [Pythium insidiosum]|uniref:Uncharacterized protein n=1 Tax=Pythium insidiosum TaxID=114742 RepID=A0AAD5Q0Y9_PYTIN|nr:hypothetical protein P43SY_011827 [Pythium insidiosum]KAJ0391477.1 hypothetical protein ATCC90586_010596 [Pythium insidiosum]